MYYYLGQRQHLPALEHAYKSPLLSASGESASAVKPSAPLGVLPGLGVPLAVDEQVLWLEVPVDQLQVVEVLEGQDDLGGVEPRVGLAAANGGRTVSRPISMDVQSNC